MDSASNGHGGGNARLRKLLAHHEQLAAEQNKIVDSIRTTLAMLDGSERATKAERAGDVVAHAIAIDTSRRKRGRPRKSPPEGKAAQRARVHALLTQYAAGETIPAEIANRLGALVHFGYVHRDADGRYTRTDKPHYANEHDSRRARAPRTAHVSTEPSDVAVMSVAELMHSLAPRDPVPPGALKFGKGMLIHHGYLRKKADGTYVRTAKPYPVADAPAAT